MAITGVLGGGTPAERSEKPGVLRKQIVQDNNAANQPQVVLREAGNLDFCICEDSSEEHGRLNPGEKIKVAGKKR